MAGITPEGLEIKRLREIIQDLESEAVIQFGAGIQTDTNSVLGRALRITSPSLSDLWEASEEVYNSFFPNRATGPSLDALAELAGITRFNAQATTSPVILTAIRGTEIPAGSLVSSSFTGEVFEINAPVFFDTNNVVMIQFEPVNAVPGNTYSITHSGSTVSYIAQAEDTVEDIASALSAQFDQLSIFTSEVLITNPRILQINSTDTFRTTNFASSANVVAREISKIGTAVAQNIGVIEQPEGTIDTVAAPIGGWVSVINPVDATVGRERETDEELRIRFANSKETRASNTLEAIYSDILGLQGIEEVIVYENATGEVDERGFPEHSIVTVVEGGNSLEIANVIWQNKPGGIQTFGNTVVTINDSQGFGQDIHFIRPVEVPIYVDLTITALDGFPANGPDQIRQAIIDYIDETYTIGDNVIYSRMYTPINSVRNHQIDSLFIGTSPNPTGTSNIEVAFDEIARSAFSYITITVN
jgi:uncharacterized phage protein gp47/JayE